MPRPSSTSAGVAIGHDGASIPFAVGGSGKHWLFVGVGATSAHDTAGQAAWIEAFGADYRLIFLAYPAEPAMYTCTPAAVARDYLAVATAAGADRFAYYGYSWGAVTGLQLALRTDRLTALICGGFPMADGPYAEMLRICRAMEAGPTRAGDFEFPWFPELSRGFVTYYEGLRSFKDRSIQAQLTIPRLNFAGTADDIELSGELMTRIGQTVSDTKADLEQFGWDVTLIDGLDHGAALANPVVVPLIRHWLTRNQDDIWG